MPPGGGSQRVRAVVSGRVQGVGFRYFVLHRAQALGLRGWVRNLRTGEVELVAEGPRPDLEELVGAVRKGPPLSWVQGVRTDWSEARGEPPGFDLKHTI